MATQEPQFHLSRFVDAQEPVYSRVHAELRAGRKTSHWMWFIFPQIRGLGRSEMAERFAISGRGEAEAYLDHSVLGPRLEECTRLVCEAPAPASEIFGYPDDLKFRSSMTLFEKVAGPESIFRRALEQFFGGGGDPLTTELLGE